MGAPLTDLGLQFVIKTTFKLIRANPDKHLPDIFGDAQLDPHAAIYGNRMVAQVKAWLLKTEIPVILGFDLTEVKLPAVTVHLSASAPHTPVIGDDALTIDGPDPLLPQEKDVLVPAFQPGALNSSDPTQWVLTLPGSMPLDSQDLFIPGLTLRDANGQEYPIGQDTNGDILIFPGQAPLTQMNYASLELISPVITGQFNRGAMVYNEQATIVIHGMSNRQEGLWVYYMVMWGLLKLRPILTGTLGLDLSLPAASDYSKDDQFLGENVWRRYITVQATSVWDWEQARKQDVVGVILGAINSAQASATPPIQ